MDFTQYISCLGYFTLDKPQIYCKNCGCDIEDEADLTLVETKDFGKRRVCAQCVVELREEGKLIQQH